MMTRLTLLLVLASALLSASTNAADYHVRPDGGTFQQCSGLADAAYTAGILERACAVHHPFELLDPQSKLARIEGGSRIFIHNHADGRRASYQMGSHGPYVDDECKSDWSYTCYMPSIPSGTAAQPTVIAGVVGDGTTCPTGESPELWGSGRAERVITLSGSKHVTLSCLTITDRNSCIEASAFPKKSQICNREAPYSAATADKGLYIEDADKIELRDLTIEGLGKGINAGRLGDITLLRTHLHANYSAGWDGDIGPEGSSNTGTIRFIDSSITFNGCGLEYAPGTNHHRQPTACAKQSLGGYGDGLGTAATGGNWIFDNTLVMYNNSDGIDLLYHENGGHISVKNSRIEGNGGNQVKLSGNSELVNNIIIGNCGWNSRQDFNLGGNGENCRALGSALSLHYVKGTDSTVLLNNTIVSEGDCLLITGSRAGLEATQQRLYIVNNIFYAAADFLQPDEYSCLHYPDANYAYTQAHNNIIHRVKNFGDPCYLFNSNVPENANANSGQCSTTDDFIFEAEELRKNTDPRFKSLDLGIVHSAYDIKTLGSEANSVHIKAGSPAIDAGYRAMVGNLPVPTTDYLGRPRGDRPDIGALESTSKRRTKPLVSATQ